MIPSIYGAHTFGDFAYLCLFHLTLVHLFAALFHTNGYHVY